MAKGDLRSAPVRRQQHHHHHHPPDCESVGRLWTYGTKYVGIMHYVGSGGNVCGCGEKGNWKLMVLSVVFDSLGVVKGRTLG